MNTSELQKSSKPDPNHEIDLKEGKFDRTTKSELVRAYSNIFNEKPRDLCVFFHGGLTSRAEGLNLAGQLIGPYSDSGSYPFFFIWNSDFLTMIREIVESFYQDRVLIDGANRAAILIAGKIENAIDVKIAGRLTSGLSGSRGKPLELRDIEKYLRRVASFLRTDFSSG